MLSDREVFACEEDCRFIGTGAALLTSALIGAGASAVEGAVQSKQTSKAVNAQTDATDKAIANLKPFQDTGTKAFTTLGALMGLGGGNSAQAQTQSALPGNGLTGPAAPPGFKAGAISDPNANGGNAAQAPGGGGLLNGTPGQVATSQSASSYPSYTPHSSPIPTVTMQGPDGSTQAVPADHVSYWVQKGATVVGHG